MRAAATGLQRIVALVAVLVLMAVSAVALDASPASALQVDPCAVIVEVTGAGEPIPCTPTATPDPCGDAGVTGQGVDPCATEIPTPEPTADPCAPTKGDPDPCASESPTPEPTSDPCAPTKGDADPCATETMTPEPTVDSCNVAAAFDTAAGEVDCETPVVDPTATAPTAIEEEILTPAPAAPTTPALRETVTSLPSTGIGLGESSERQPASMVPLLAALLMIAVAVVATLTRRRLTR